MTVNEIPRIDHVDRVLRVEDVMARTGLRKTVLHELVNAGEFPAPFKLSERGRAVGYLESEIRIWIASRVATRGAPAFLPGETQL